MNYKEALEQIVAGNETGWQQLHTLLWQDYNGMLSGIGNKEQAGKIFNNAFSAIASSINNQTNPDMIGDIFRRKLEWEISNASASNRQNDFRPQMNQGAQAGQGAPAGLGIQAGQGAPAGQRYQQPYSNPNPQMQAFGNGMQAGNVAPKKSKAPLVIGIVAALVVIVGVLLVLVVFGKKKFDKEGYRDVLDEYFECYSDQDMKAMEAYYPEDSGEQIWDKTFSMMGFSSEEDYWATLSAAYGDPFTITCTVDDTKIARKSEMEKYEEAFNEEYDTDCDLDYLIQAEIKETVVGDLNSTSYTETIVLGVIDGKWYIMGANY